MSSNISTESLFSPFISVIIPIYNGEADIPGLIASLFAQTYPQQKVEYLLVDNRSSDRTPELLLGAITDNYPQINLRYLQEDKIQSAYAARNTGLRVSTGEIVAFTDADCRPDANWLVELVKPFTEENIGIVAGEITALPGETWLEKYAANVGMMSQKWLVEHDFLPYGQTANLAIRKIVFSQIGLFRPYLTSGGDADICWRIQQQSDWQLKFAPKALVFHRHRGNLVDFQKQWQRYGRSNRYLHELYGVSLGPEFTISQGIYRISRWLLKELPITTIKLLKGENEPIDLLKTPIGLVGFRARSLGQKQAELPEIAKQIDWL